MKLLDHYDGSELPFEGDLTLTLRSLPQGARINSAKIRLTPVDASGGTDPFTESIAFTGNSGTWNATKAANADWVEVDFHDRRTLVSVQGSHLTNSTLQIDLGGAYVEINDKGAIKTPGDNDFLVNGNGSLLPGLTVNKFKLTSASASPDIHTVIVRSAPANVQLRLADLAPAWSYVGDMTTAQTTPDLAEVLQATLADLELDNSYYILPISLHSDTIARFQVTVEIDYVLETALLPADLSEVTLPYAYNTIANSEEGLLQVALPANAKVLPRDTAAKVIGAFEDTRIVYGALGTVSAQGEALISPALTQAQPLALDKPLAATAVDLLLASVTRTARLRLDVREDLDGKPAGASLLTGNVEVHLDRESASQATWTSVDLPREFQFKAQNEMQYWVVIQSLEGEAVWSVSPISPGGLGMQSTDNGGLSWRLSQVRSIGGAITGRLRLRRVPERYQVPVELSIGEGDQAQRVKLDRFQPLGRVDFELNIPEMADAFNNYLRQASAAACFEAEHIADGEFNQWLRSGTELADTTTTIPLTFEPTRVAVTPDGSAAYVATLESLVSTSIGTTHLEKIVTTSNTARTLDVQAPGSAIALNFSPNGDRLYLLTATAESALTIIDTNDDHLIRTTDLGALGVSDMAVNPDGSRLYVAQYSKNFGSIRPYDTSQFTAVAADIVIGAGLAPLAVTVSAMGTARTFLYVLVNEVTLQGHNIYGQNLLYRYDTDRHMLAGAPLRLGRGGGDLTIASCGQLAIVSNVDDNSLNVVDLEQWKVIGSAIDVNAEVEGVVLSPDCARAYGYYIGESASFITAADTRQRRKIHEKDITGFIRDIAIGPNGDQLYVAVHDNSLAIIATAPSAPLEWTVAAGRATHLCYPSPFGNVAVLGVSELNTDPVPVLSPTVSVFGAPPPISKPLPRFTGLINNVPAYGPKPCQFTALPAGKLKATSTSTPTPFPLRRNSYCTA
jgi:DNA-binding beta-propeller fold protein YncE